MWPNDDCPNKFFQSVLWERPPEMDDWMSNKALRNEKGGNFMMKPSKVTTWGTYQSTERFAHQAHETARIEVLWIMEGQKGSFSGEVVQEDLHRGSLKGLCLMKVYLGAEVIRKGHFR